MTNAELAVLGLLIEQPRHGYEIEQVIEARGMREWTEVAFSSIYYLLRKLEKEGLVRGRLAQQPGKGPARKVYAVTEAGQAAWRQATLEALSTPYRPAEPFLLGLSGFPAFSPEEIAAALQQYHGRLAEQMAHIQARRQAAGEQLPLYIDGLFDFSLHLVQARMDWIDGFMNRLAEEGNSGN